MSTGEDVTKLWTVKEGIVIDKPCDKLFIKPDVERQVFILFYFILFYNFFHSDFEPKVSGPKYWSLIFWK